MRTYVCSGRATRRQRVPPGPLHRFPWRPFPLVHGPSGAAPPQTARPRTTSVPGPAVARAMTWEGARLHRARGGDAPPAVGEMRHMRPCAGDLALQLQPSPTRRWSRPHHSAGQHENQPHVRGGSHRLRWHGTYGMEVLVARRQGDDEGEGAHLVPSGLEAW